MADSHAIGSQAHGFAGIKVNTVGQPYPLVHPAGVLKIIQRPQPKHLQAKVRFVVGLRQVGVQAHIQLMGQFRGGLHNLPGHGEW